MLEAESLLEVVKSFDPLGPVGVAEDDEDVEVADAEDEEDEGLFLMGAFLFAGKISSLWISLWGKNSVAIL